MCENTEMALSSVIGKQVTRIAGAMWAHNLHSTDEEEMVIQMPRGRTITTSLRPPDVCNPIRTFMHSAIGTAYGDKWKLVTTAESGMWLGNDGILTDYGTAKWQMLVSRIADTIDHIKCGDAKY